MKVEIFEDFPETEEGRDEREEVSEWLAKDRAGSGQSRELDIPPSPSLLHGRSASWGSLSTLSTGDATQKKMSDMEKQVSGASGH